MKKIAVFLMVCLMVGSFILVGCEKKVEKTFSKPFIGGTESIKFDFIEGSPPAEVYDAGSYPFEAAVSVENKGEYNVLKDKITIDLVGFYPKDFDLTADKVKKSPDENLEPAYIDSEGNIIPGTVTYVTFPGFNFKSKLLANNEYRMRANLCYVYGTNAQADLCILDDLTKTSDEVCKVTEKKNAESSSAPVKIENFEESVAGTDKITFSFEVVHRGKGLVSEKDSKCSDDTIKKNKVWVEVTTGLEGLSCSGLSDGTATGNVITGYTTLYGGKRMIRCTQDTSKLTGDFEKKVTVKAVYDYKEHKETTITVKHTT